VHSDFGVVKNLIPGAAFFELATTPPSVLIDELLEEVWDGVISVSFLFSSAVLLLLDVIQKIAVAFLIAAGPIVIALSAFPGPTSGFLFSWMLTLLEVSMWAFASRVLTALLQARFSGQVTGGVAESVANKFSSGDDAIQFTSYFENLAFCVILTGAYFAIPVICAAIFRGGGMASVAGDGIGRAFSFAAGAATGRVLPGMSLSPSRGGASGGGGSPAQASSTGGGGGEPAASGERAGDKPSGRDERAGAIAKHRAVMKNMRRGGD